MDHASAGSLDVYTSSMTRLHQHLQEFADECVIVRARFISRTLTAIYDSHLRPHGVKASQMNILVVTGKLDLATPQKVCSYLNLEASTLSRNVERMRAKGWLKNQADADGRAAPFSLTAKGQRLLEEIRPSWRRAQAEANELLGKTGSRDLDRIADRIRNRRS